MIRVLLAASTLVVIAAACTHDARPADTAAAGPQAAVADSALSPPVGRPRDRNGAPRRAPVAAGQARLPNGAVPATHPVLPVGAAAPRTTPRATPIVDSARGEVAPANPAASAPTTAPLVQPATPARAPLPYSPGERLAYDVKFSSIDVGNAVMEVVGLENVRGRQAMHVRFNVKGGTFLFRVNDRYESWIDTVHLVSLRHWQQIDEGSYERQRRYEIMPEIGTYKENEKPEQPTVKEPLDDGSFFFFLRTIPLEVGKTYSFDRYFKPDRNPVTVTVVRRERIKVPAGTFDAIVLHPTIKAKGVFGEGGQAEIWLADDSTRMMLQMKSKLKIGSLSLYLKSIRRGGS